MVRRGGGLDSYGKSIVYFVHCQYDFVRLHKYGYFGNLTPWQAIHIERERVWPIVDLDLMARSQKEKR
ncbi:MAG TPA: hypothetical protein VG797_05620 [Phycisphaerales bacterium]|nr:hypothetical protein [Phycisphaerales bacterium]